MSKQRIPHAFYIRDGGRKLPSSHCRFCEVARRRDKNRRHGLWEYFVNDAWTRKAPRCYRSVNAGPEPPRKETMEKAHEFQPDYSSFMTTEEMERHFADFKFLGVGWYVRKAQVLLVLPHTAIRQKGEDQQAQPLYLVAAYQDRNPAEAFNQIANATVRVDVR